MFQFSKYQGLGNDFLIMDGRLGQLPDSVTHPDAAWVQLLCNRHFGVGADGLILALPPEANADLRMRIFNADGSEAEMCGNGIRCLARFLADSDGNPPGTRWAIETPAGLIRPELQPDGQLRVDMGSPFLIPDQIPTTLSIGPCGLPEGEVDLNGHQLEVAAVGMGNPHVIVPVDDLQTIPFVHWGESLEVHPFFPAKTNVHFLKVHDRNHLEIRVWERGAGPTLACGTGACATLVAAVLLGLADELAEVKLPGGSLLVSWTGRTGPVLMTGPAMAVFDGVITPELAPVLSTAKDSGPTQPSEELTPDSDQRQPGVDSDVSAEDEAAALAKVASFLENTSLDSMLNLASESLEERTRARYERDRT